jgi:hypothetical protein
VPGSWRGEKAMCEAPLAAPPRLLAVDTVGHWSRVTTVEDILLERITEGNREKKELKVLKLL